MKKVLMTFVVMLLAFQFTLSGKEFFKSTLPEKNIVTATKRLYLHGYEGAYNPSIVKFNEGYLLIFRYIPTRFYAPWISEIGLVLLDESFEPISDVQLLNTRLYNDTTPSQSEDARIVSCNGKLYVIYNDNMELTFPTYWERRDMYIAELLYNDNQFVLDKPVKLFYGAKYRETPWQKNWTPFEWNGRLMLAYTINPLEVICPNLETGTCELYCQTKKKTITWNLGPLRGGTPAELVNGEYLAFFHSGIILTSSCSDSQELWHYFMGAYTFSAEPPFEITKISSEPINALGFYTYSSYSKRTIYPCGFVVDGSNLYLTYGKDDSEVWIATIDLNELINSLEPVK